MNCIITDDEQNSREALKNLLALIAPTIQVVAEAVNTQEAKLLVEKLNPDILFLDINMPGQTGIEFLETHGPLNCQVIFTTAYNEYAVKAFRLNAIDFLLKPIDPDDLESAIKKATTYKTIFTSQQLQATQAIIKKNHTAHNQKLAVSNSDDIHFLEIQNIIYIEASGPYTNFYINEQNKITISKPLKEYDELLSSFNFLRVHQSFLVNINHIKKYIKGDGGQLIMTNDHEVEVSRRKKDNLMEMLKNIALK